MKVRRRLTGPDTNCPDGPQNEMGCTKSLTGVHYCLKGLPWRLGTTHRDGAVANIGTAFICLLTMRLSDAELRRRPMKLIYPNHRPFPWPTEEVAPRSLQPIVRSRMPPCLRPDRRAGIQNPQRQE